MSRNIIQMNRVGEIIRSKREKKEMLLRQLAAKIDIDQAILSKIERGERKARREQIQKIGVYDKFPLSSFFSKFNNFIPFITFISYSQISNLLSPFYRPSLS